LPKATEVGERLATGAAAVELKLTPLTFASLITTDLFEGVNANPALLGATV
jgi:hypothetical protein